MKKKQRVKLQSKIIRNSCLSRAAVSCYENALADLVVKKSFQRLGSDIGAYNICGHGCLYCYANDDKETVVKNRRLHHAYSPLLIREVSENDVIKQAEQKSWKNGQIDIFDFLQF